MKKPEATAGVRRDGSQQGAEQKPRHVGRRADRGFRARSKEHAGPNFAGPIRSYWSSIPSCSRMAPKQSPGEARPKAVPKRDDEGDGEKDGCAHGEPPVLPVIKL